jgi:NAD-dependent SIR2 family protein deacetylase
MGALESHDEDDEINKLADAIGSNLSVSENDSLRAVAALIEKHKAKKIMVLAGAGVSVAAGIPDFRTPGTGLYDNLQKYNLPFPEAVFDVGFYSKNPKPFCALAKELWPGQSHSPTLTHSFLKLLSDKGLLLRTYTQNIDGLEHLAGIPDDKVVECHGHFRTARCTTCDRAADGEVVKKTILAGKVPECKKCAGHVKPDIVFFGESMPDRFSRLLKKDRKEADLLIIMGTSLQVAPVSMIPNMVSCNRVLFNREEVLSLKAGDHFIEGDCDVNVEKLCELLGWKEKLLAQNAKTKIVVEKKEAPDTPSDAEKD